MDESWLQQMNDEAREKQLFNALDECEKKGVSRDSMLILMFETGARWEAREHQPL